MPNQLIDFILPTCPGIPDAMWIASGAYITWMQGFALTLLYTGFLTQLLFTGLSESTNGRVNILGYLKLLGRTFGLTLFIIYAKRIFFTFDVFIDLLCPRSMDLLHQVNEAAKLVDTTKVLGFLGGLKAILGMILNGAVLFTVEGAIILVNYFKSILLIFLCVTSNISAGLTLFPFFSKSFNTWMKAYITVSFWTLTLEVFSVINTSSYITDTFSEQEPLSQFILSLVMFFAVLMTPAWTSMFINSVATPNLIGAVGQGSMSIARSVGKLSKFLKR